MNTLEMFIPSLVFGLCARSEVSVKSANMLWTVTLIAFICALIGAMR